MFKSWSVAQKCGAFLLCFLLAFAYLQPYFYPMDEAFQNLNKILQKPTALYWFGTDHFGRDMLSRLASAIRLSFSLILLSVVVHCCLVCYSVFWQAISAVGLIAF